MASAPFALILSEASGYAGRLHGSLASGDGAPVHMAQASGRFSVADVRGTSGTEVPLQIRVPDEAGTSYSFFMFRNMPEGFELSAGFGTKTYWAVSFHDYDGLKMMPPAGYTGSFELEVLLVKTIGTDPERDVAQVAILPSAQGVPPTSAADGASSRILTSTGPQSEETIEAIQNRLEQARATEEQPVAQEMTAGDRSMMARGDTLLQQGDVASARLIYRQLARKNIAEGAFAMGKTYDPEFLASIGVQGLHPNAEEAKTWYKKAQDLGSRQAEQRLTALVQSGY